jgi:TonB family protein
MFTLGAGSFLMNINNSIQPQKTYEMEFVKRKVSPAFKKETMRKETLLKEIQVASLTPKAMPLLQPKIPVRQTSRQTRKARPILKAAIATPKQVKSSVTRKTVVIRSKRSTKKRIPMARSFVNVNKAFSSRSTRAPMVQGTPQFKLRKLPQRTTKSSSSVSSSEEPTRVAMVQGTPKFKLSKLPNQVIRSKNSSSTWTEKGRMNPVQTRVRLASLASFPSARSVPSIDDSGARAGYTALIQRRIEDAKEYPKGSQKLGRQGVLKVQFTILKNGQLGNVSLLTETEYPELNQAAMAAVKRAAPFSGIPDSIMGQSLSFIVPIKFKVN